MPYTDGVDSVTLGVVDLLLAVVAATGVKLSASCKFTQRQSDDRWQYQHHQAVSPHVISVQR